MRFLEGVAVPDVAHQFAGSGEAEVTEFTAVRFGACMGVHVVLKGRQGLEAHFANGALVRPLLRMGFHVARQ